MALQTRELVTAWIAERLEASQIGLAGDEARAEAASILALHEITRPAGDAGREWSQEGARQLVDELLAWRD